MMQNHPWGAKADDRMFHRVVKTNKGRIPLANRLRYIKWLHQRRHSDLDFRFTDDWEEELADLGLMDVETIVLPKKGYWTACYGGSHSIPIREAPAPCVTYTEYLTNKEELKERIALARREKFEEEERAKNFWDGQMRNAKSAQQIQEWREPESTITLDIVYRRLLADEDAQRNARRVMIFLKRIARAVDRWSSGYIKIDQNEHTATCQSCGMEAMLFHLVPLDQEKVIDQIEKFQEDHEYHHAREGECLEA